MIRKLYLGLGLCQKKKIFFLIFIFYLFILLYTFNIFLFTDEHDDTSILNIEVNKRNRPEPSALLVLSKVGLNKSLHALINNNMDNDRLHDESKISSVHGFASFTKYKNTVITHSRTMYSQEINHTSGKSKARARLKLSDMFISVKTTRSNHKTRLDLILQTWFAMAHEQTYIFTDTYDAKLTNQIGSSHLINTNCSEGHSRVPLCCKMSAEYDHFISSGKRWFCHVDDDNYVNVNALVKFLAKYPHNRSWYIGTSSTKTPVTVTATHIADGGRMPVTFWFATGGAGFCLSRALALRMVPYARYGGLMKRAEEIKLPDDVTVGYVIAHYLNVTLSKSHLFHSHLENLSKLAPANFSKQVTFSYHVPRGNLIQTGPVVPFKDDVTRMKTLHCMLYPNFKMCKDRTSTHGR